jgi:hypothetical protein
MALSADKVRGLKNCEAAFTAAIALSARLELSDNRKNLR